MQMACNPPEVMANFNLQKEYLAARANDRLPVLLISSCLSTKDTRQIAGTYKACDCSEGEAAVMNQALLWSMKRDDFCWQAVLFSGKSFSSQAWIRYRVV